MRQGKLRPIELVEHCLGRIHQFEDQIHAWVMVDEEGARQEAQRLGKLLDDGQEPVGPLHGIPIGIKDIIDVAGWPTLCGSKLREGHVADKDAFVVEHLRKAGAIILGKTVTTEWASFDPPPTRNPWNLNHTPGGSSSGSAAAVAMEMCLAALGTQTGGSIIRPASYCGVVGFKPSYRMPSLEGIYPFSHNLDHVGPMATSVPDTAAVWGALVPESLSRQLPKLNATNSRKLYFLEGGILDEADQSMKVHFQQLKAMLSRKASIQSAPFPTYLSDVPALHACIMAVEGAETHRERFERDPNSFAFHIRSLIEEGRRSPVLEYARAIRRQRELQQGFAREFLPLAAEGGILAMPSTPTVAPDHSTTGRPIFNSLWSFLGLPTITIPSGQGENGLPYGLQLVSPGFAGCPNLFQVAEECERIIGWNRRPEILTSR